MDDTARQAILDRYGVSPDHELGHGGEAWVYALDAHRVLRVHRAEAAAHVRSLGDLYGCLDRAAVPYALPEVLEVEGDGEVSWSIERRLPGRPFDGLLALLRGEDRAGALGSYVDGAAAFRQLGLPPGWGTGVGDLFMPDAIRTERWGDLLAERLGRQLDRARPLLEGVVPDLDAIRTRLVGEARMEAASRRSLVHGDWFPGNVLLGEDLKVSAAIDLGWLTVVGEPDHDIRSAVVFCEVHPWLEPGDDEVLLDAARRHLGRHAVAEVGRTRRFEQARFAFVDDDPHLHHWCITGLRAIAADL